MNRKFYLTCFLLYLISQIFFLISIQFPRGHHFDEFHYVPSAKQFLALKENKNWEHPPLGKLLMALGIHIAGDRPIGWRLMSTVFGALSLVGIYVWGFALFKRRDTALFAALITLLNQLLYVQARIGMLDTLMTGFLIWGLALFTFAWNPQLKSNRVRILFAGCGVFLGLAIACKWIAIIPWLTCIGFYFFIRLLQFWKVQFASIKVKKNEEWYSPTLWAGIKAHDLFFCLGMIPILIYFLTFIPLFFIHRTPPYTLLDILKMQVQMWQGQLRVVSDHPYMSHWLGWPLMIRPIWYAFDKEGSAQEWVRGVILLGNPLVLWVGLLAWIATAWMSVKERSRSGFLIIVFCSSLFFCWAIIPRKIAFFYYYYPSAMILSLALAFCFQHWKRLWSLRWIYLTLCLGVFIYFFPILAAMKIPAHSFIKWMWFRSWI